MTPLIISAIVITGIVFIVRKAKKASKSGIDYHYSPDKKPKGSGRDIDKEEDYTEN